MARMIANSQLLLMEYLYFSRSPGKDTNLLVSAYAGGGREVFTDCQY